MEVGLGLKTMVVKGVSSSCSALLMEDDLTPGVKMEENRVTSFSSVLLSLGWSSSCLLE